MYRLVTSALAIALAMVGKPAWATADGPDFFMVRGVAPNDVLYIRQTPSAAAPKVGEVPHDGRRLRNLECRAFHNGRQVIDSDVPLPGTTRWCRIHFNGTEGWVNARYLGEEIEAEEG